MKGFFSASLLLASIIVPARGGLDVLAMGAEFWPGPRVMIKQAQSDDADSMIVRNESQRALDWNATGFFQRNRDVGQVFTPEIDFFLDAIILRTSATNDAVRKGAAGAEVFVQFFELISDVRSQRDEEELRFKSIKVARRARFPNLPATNSATTSTNATGSAGTYLRWQFTGGDRLQFERGKRYAFLVGFLGSAPERAFTLASASADRSAGVTEIDPYPGGWVVHREGDGTLAPGLSPGDAPPANVSDNRRLKEQSAFKGNRRRFALEPSTRGFPGITTSRDLEFYIEGAPIR